MDIPLGWQPGRRGRKTIKSSGIFYAFKPQRIEYLITEDEATEKYLKELKSQGITPIVVPKKFEHLHKRGEGKSKPRVFGDEEVDRSIADFA